MYTLIFILLLGVFTILISRPQQNKQLSPISHKLSDRMVRLWEVAHLGMKDNKMLRAEKALLTILNIDQKNAAAYNRLGILYAKQKEYKDAIDCFEIASSIEPSAPSFHNLGLIYYETEHYEKAVTAFEQALQIEDDLRARHIAHAKANQKLERYGQMVKSLEKAVEIEPSYEALKLLLQAYITVDDKEKIRITKAKLTRHQNQQPKKKKRLPRRVQRPKRIVR